MADNEPLNLAKSTCRSWKCTYRAVAMVHDGFCGYLLCAAHVRMATARVNARGEATVTPAAQVNPDPDMDRQKALQVAGQFDDESEIS